MRELIRDSGAMRFDIGTQVFPVAITHGKAQTQTVDVCLRQIVSLTIAHGLNKILDAPQKSVRCA
jgi:hypothetical protein